MLMLGTPVIDRIKGTKKQRHVDVLTCWRVGVGVFFALLEV